MLCLKPLAAFFQRKFSWISFKGLNEKKGEQRESKTNFLLFLNFFKDLYIVM